MMCCKFAAADAVQDDVFMLFGGGGKDLSQRVVYRTAKTAVYVNLAKGVGRNRNKANKDRSRGSRVLKAAR